MLWANSILLCSRCMNRSNFFISLSLGFSHGTDSYCWMGNITITFSMILLRKPVINHSLFSFSWPYPETFSLFSLLISSLGTISNLTSLPIATHVIFHFGHSSDHILRSLTLLYFPCTLPAKMPSWDSQSCPAALFPSFFFPFSSFLFFKTIISNILYSSQSPSLTTWFVRNCKLCFLLSPVVLLYWTFCISTELCRNLPYAQMKKKTIPQS